MYTLAPEEKATLVMVYTQNYMVRGEVVTRQNMRVSTWLRTQSVPRYIHLLNANVLMIGGGAPKNQSYKEFFIPLELVIGFHMVPPLSDPMDYEEGEKNRAMLPAIVTIGSFLARCELRVSASTGIGPTLELSKVPWLSLYHVEINNPFLPQMPMLKMPLMLVSPTQVAFAIQD